MLKKLLLSALFLPLSVLAQSADIKLPKKGTQKSSVEAHYGQPNRQLGPIGNPPITQWIYDRFTVVFEYDHVVHAYARDLELENRPQSAIPTRPSLLTMPKANGVPITNTKTISPAEPKLIDDREQATDSPYTETDTESDFDTLFNSEEDAIIESKDDSENTP